MAKRTTKPAAKSTNTEGAPSAKAAPTAEPNPAGGAQSSTNVTGDAPEVQTTEAGQAADAGMTAPATAEPEPTSVVDGAPSSSAEAVAAAAQATETGEAVGQVVTGDLPATGSDGQADAAEVSSAGEAAEENKTSTGSFEDKVAEAFAAQAGLDEKTVEAIKAQILGLPSTERRCFPALKTIRHDNRRVSEGGVLTLTRSAHAKLAARKLVSEDWDAGLVVED